MFYKQTVKSRWWTSALPDCPAASVHKHELPLVDTAHRYYTHDKKQLRTVSNEVVLIADFDVLPKGFSSWQDFQHELMQSFHSNYAVPIESASHKRKLLFNCQWEGGSAALHSSTALRQCLEVLLTPRWFEYVDPCYSAMTTSFLTPSLHFVLDASMMQSVVTHNIPDLLEIWSKASPNDEPHWRTVQLPDTLKRLRLKGVLLEVLEDVASTYGIQSVSGAELPQTCISRRLMRAQGQVSRALTQLEELGVIECVSKGFLAGMCSKRWRITKWYQWKDTRTSELREPAHMTEGKTYELFPAWVRWLTAQGLTGEQLVNELMIEAAGTKLTRKECEARLSSLLRQ